MSMATASYLSTMEYTNKPSRISPSVSLGRFYGRSLMRMHVQPVFPKNSLVFARTSMLYSPPPRRERTMEASDKDYVLCGGRHGHVASRRNTPSVSSLTFSLHALVHHLISHSAEVHGFTNEQKSRAEDAFKNYGPTLRICIDFVSDPILLTDYEALLDGMASGLTAHSLRYFVLKGV